MRVGVLLAWLGVLGAAPPGALASSIDEAHSRVRVSSDLATLDVRACALHATVWRLPSGRFRDFVVDLEVGGRTLRSAPRSVETTPPACLAYRFDLARAQRSERSRNVVRVGDDVLASADAWLFEPRGLASHEVLFELPQGIEVSAPWLPLDLERTRYRVGPVSEGSRALVAFGHFRQFRLAAGGAHLDVAMLEGDPPARAGDVATWVGAAARQVLLAYGEFPVPRAQILIVPVRGAWPSRRRWAGDEAVPFARVMRNGGPAVQFFVDQTAAVEEYLEDWTATHEFSHLLLPYVGRSDAWLSEGFATYYQNVLMARAGVLDERTAWQKLYDGFERGRRERYSDTLAESIRERGDNMIMRMYWSGAAIALMADVTLRRPTTDAGGSLDTVMEAVRTCCLASGHTWSGRELFDQLDMLAGRKVFAPLYARWVPSTEFPAVDGVLEELGVRARRGRVTLDDAAPLAGVRRAIMAPRSGN